MLALPVLALLVVAVAATDIVGPRRRDLADGGPGDAPLGHVHEPAVLRHEADHARLHDGFGINAWSQESYAAVRSEAAKCKNVKQIVAAGGGDLQKSISDVNSMVAQGANAIVLIPDFGQAQLASIQARHGAGVKVVPWGADPGGTPGKDYVTYVDWSSPTRAPCGPMDGQAARRQGQRRLPRRPGRQPGQRRQLKSIVKGLRQAPGMKLLTGKKN